MKGIIPIGGRGTRMRPATYTVNKHFIPIANKPLIFYPIETLVNAGINDIAITYNPGQLEHAKEFLGNGSKWNAKFTYILQEKPAGLANIVQVCQKWVGNDSFVFHLGDNIFVDGIKDLVDFFKIKKPDGLIAILHHPENTRLGVPYFDKNNRLIEYVEKPSSPPHDYAIPGIYFGNVNFFKAFSGADRIKPSARGELEIPSPFMWLIKNKFTVLVKEYKGRWFDPGKFSDWLETNEFLLKNQLTTNIISSPDNKTKMLGTVSVGKNCVIQNCKITGPVAIGNNVIIKNSKIGPNSSIYHNCQIENCRIENSVLMDGVKLQSIKKPIELSIIGPNCEITGNADKKISLFLGEMGKISI